MIGLYCRTYEDDKSDISMLISINPYDLYTGLRIGRDGIGGSRRAFGHRGFHPIPDDTIGTVLS